MGKSGMLFQASLFTHRITLPALWVLMTEHSWRMALQLTSYIDEHKRSSQGDVPRPEPLVNTTMNY